MLNFSGQKLFWIFLIPALGIIFFIGSSFLNRPEVIEITSQPSQISTSTPEKEKSITIILVGDIIFNRGVEYMIEKVGKGDFKFPFLKIADGLKGARLLFGNLEGPISDKGERVGSIYSFQNDSKSIEGLTYAGFDILSLANNHAFDYGREALEDCLAKLSNAGIDYIGAGLDKNEAYSPIIKKINGTKMLF